MINARDKSRVRIVLNSDFLDTSPWILSSQPLFSDALSISMASQGIDDAVPNFENFSREEIIEQFREQKRRADESEQRLAEEQRLNRSTTFQEYIQLCHEHLHQALHVETDFSSTTHGYTSPTNKYCPTRLTPWEAFPTRQMKQFDDAHSLLQLAFGEDPRLFKPALYLTLTGSDLAKKKLASEQDLTRYEYVALEQPVESIINQLCKYETAQEQFRLGDGIAFKDNSNSLRENKEQAENPATPTKPSGRADRYCVYKQENSALQLLFVVEYKPPHKYLIGNIKAGFRPMNIIEVLSRVSVPSDPDEKLQHNADALVAAMASQTFHYMIEGGLEFSYITTGEAFIFLHIKESDPETLHYHVSVPGEEFDRDDIAASLKQTAVGQVLGFSLMAFKSKKRPQSWITNATKTLHIYAVSDAMILAQLPDSERKQTPKFSAYRGRKTVTHKRHNTRLRTNRVNPGCDSGKSDYSNESDSSCPDTPSRSGSSYPFAPNATTAKGQDKLGGETSKHISSTGTPRERGHQQRYCTQKCLRGVTRSEPLDKDCPNSSLHPSHGGRHAINSHQFQRLIQDQLAQDRDHDCEPLGTQGSRGALFRLTLASHGYVFVGKGTVDVFIRDLRYEGRIYRHLKDLQGSAIPVYLGNIDLEEVYFLDIGVQISHMLLLSWGGRNIDGVRPQTRVEIDRTVREVRNLGIDQHDEEVRNLLWNEERQRVMLIDFERATYIAEDDSMKCQAIQVHEDHEGIQANDWCPTCPKDTDQVMAQDGTDSADDHYKENVEPSNIAISKAKKEDRPDQGIRKTTKGSLGPVRI